MRIGHGYDVHKLVALDEYLKLYPERQDQAFVLGGVEIEHDKRLVGHSDADLVIHALCDALLGASANRDIGFHFPDNDSAYSGISSLLLLEKVRDLIKGQGYGVVNIDITVMAEQPKLNKHIDAMIAKLASCLEIEKSQINIKATTTEKLGFVGREEGIAAEAVCLITKL